MIEYNEYRMNFAVSSDGQGVNYATSGFDGNSTEVGDPSNRFDVSSELSELADLCDEATSAFHEAASKSHEHRVTALCVSTNQIVMVDGSLDVRNRRRLRVEGRVADGPPGILTIGGTGSEIDARLNHESARALGKTVCAVSSDQFRACSVRRSVSDVLLSSHAAGVLAHETWGHTLETDLRNLPNWVPSHDTRIASESIVIVDDPSLVGGWGTFRVDDTGSVARSATLVENGTVRDRIAGVPGRMRRASWRHRALPRMSNTLVLPASKSSERPMSELMEESDVLVERISGGAVDPNTGRFTFHVSAGKQRSRASGEFHPIGAFTISGRVATILKSVIGVGPADLVDIAPASCVKEGQRVWVGVGGSPMLLGGIDVA